MNDPRPFQPESRQYHLASPAGGEEDASPQPLPQTLHQKSATPAGGLLAAISFFALLAVIGCFIFRLVT